MDRILSPSTSSTLRSSVLPVLTASLGTVGLLSGFSMFYMPVDAARAFGVAVDPESNQSSQHTALINAIGIRNIGSGASLLAITAFWKFSSLCRTSPIAALAVKRTLGLSLLVGTVVALGDSFLLSRLVNRGAPTGEAEKVAGEAGQGHAVVAVPILGLALGYLLT